MQFINFNLIPFILIGALIVFGMVFGDNRVRMITLGASLALFGLSQWPSTSLEEVSQKGLFGIHLTVVQLQILTLAVIVGLFAFGSLIGERRARFKGRSIVLSVLTALTVLSFGIALMPAGDRTSLVTDYNLAAMAYSMRFMFLIALTIWLIVVQFVPDKEDKRRH